MAESSDLDKQFVKASVAAALFGSQAPLALQLGRFKLARVLGRGAMGTVFEACDLVSGERLALKVLNECGGAEIYQIKREFRSLAGVVHPNLVALHELICEDTRWFFTMELVEGVTFDGWVRPNSASGFVESRLRGALRQLALAVRAIHSAGQLHRDLKPTNVLVTSEGTVKVLDFGLVRETGFGASSQTELSGLAGTPAYVAPELAAGERASESSDWYALGVMLFQALTGKLPFDGNPFAILRNKQRLEAPRADSLDADLPSDLVELCQGLLLRDPSARLRFAAATEFLGASSPRSTLNAPARPIFVGRIHELAALQEAFAACEAGSPQVVLLEGRSGMGKSALLEHFAGDNPDALVLSGRCYEQESVPFKVFDGVVDALITHLRRLADGAVQRLLPRHLTALTQLFPVFSSVRTIPASGEERATTPDQRDRAFAALKELLLRLTDQYRVIIAVDDLQWGDADSILMLKHLFGAPEPPPLLFLGTYRTDDAQANEFLQQLRDQRTLGAQTRIRTLNIGPLPVEAGVSLVHRLSHSLDVSAIAESIVAEAVGVPFFIVELVRLLEGGRCAGAARSAQPHISLDDLVVARVSAMSDGARRVLDVMAVAAAPLERAVVEHAAGLSDDAQTLSALRAAHLIRRSGNGSTLELYHDRLREALVARLPPGQLPTVHALIAQAMLDYGGEDPERLIAHFIGAGQQQRAGQAAVRAAHAAAQKLAFNRAAELFEWAIELLPEREIRREHLHFYLGSALANAGWGARSAEAYLAAAAGASGERAIELQRKAAQQYLRSGRAKEGAELAEKVLTDSGVRLPRSEVGMIAAFFWERARLKARGLQTSKRRTDASDPSALRRLNALRDLAPELGIRYVVTGAMLQTRYLNEALDAKDPSYSLQALVWEAYNVALMRHPRDSKWIGQVLERASVLGAQLQSPYARALVQFGEAARLLYSGSRYRDAIAPLLSAKETFAAECTGAFWERGVMSVLHLLCLEFTGSLSEQVELSEMALRDAGDRDDRFLALLLLLAMPYAHLIRNDPEAAMDFLSREQAWLEPGHDNHRHLWLLRMLDTLIYMGSATKALELLEAHWHGLTQSHIYRSPYLRDGAHWFKARCALAAYAETGEQSALLLAREAVRALRKAPGAFGACGVALSAGLAAIAGDRGRSAQELEAAYEGLRAAQADVIALYAQHRLYEQRNDSAGVARAADALRKQGVVDTERWLWTHLPIRVGRRP